MAYAIHIDVFIIMPLITGHNVWTELQPWCGCELMRNAWEWEWEWHVGKMGVLYLSIIRLAHKLLFAQEANEQSFCTLLERSNANCILLKSGNMAMKKVSARPHQGCQSRDCHLPSRRRGKDVQLRQTWWRNCPIYMCKPTLWSMTWTEKAELGTESQFLPGAAKAFKLAIVRPSRL